MNIAVITPTLSERAPMLAEAMASVAAQTLMPMAHVVWVDHARVGCGAARAAAVKVTDADWLAFLDDDDLLYPDHLERLASSAGNADVVYSWCDVTGRPWCPNRHFDADELRRDNFIPVTALVRRDVLVSVGGFRTTNYAAGVWDDWDLWLRMLDDGARFTCIPEITWQYRFHGANASLTT